MCINRSQLVGETLLAASPRGFLLHGFGLQRGDKAYALLEPEVENPSVLLMGSPLLKVVDGRYKMDLETERLKLVELTSLSAVSHDANYIDTAVQQCNQ